MFGQEGGCNKMCLITCVLQNVKVTVFCQSFCQNLVDFKKHCKNRCFNTFLKQTKARQIHFEGLLCGPSRGYYLVQVCCVLKMANLDQIITPEIVCAQFLFNCNLLKPLCLCCF